MSSEVTPRALQAAGLETAEAEALAVRFAELSALAPDDAWWRLAQETLRPDQPFAVHELLYRALSARWKPEDHGPLPAWRPDPERVTNVGSLMDGVSRSSYGALHAWSVAEREPFWRACVKRVGIELATPPESFLDLSAGREHPVWLKGARLNIAASCFDAADDAPAIVFQREGGPLGRWSVADLRALSGRVANGLVAAGFAPGDAIAIDMPMTPESVAIYLGIVRAGCAAISIADSFSPPEIETRLRIGEAQGIFTQDVMLRAGKTLPLFSKVCQAGAPRAIVLRGADEPPSLKLRAGDLAWEDFLSDTSEFEDVLRDPADDTNILFSSGTTGEPKAIPWSHTTPIKCAVDAYLHHDIQPGDVVAWPTNLGWMMGPWLIYAALVNRASIALYCGAPTEHAFGRFVQEAWVTMLGVVPSLVKAWRSSGCLDGLDWSAIKCFSSTGECSNESDMLWLMSRAPGYRPVIEYCGGTEIGGGYVTGTLVQPAAPATFTTPALGLGFRILDEAGEDTNNGEVFLVPPSLGLSQRLLNRDHHEVYFAGSPQDGEGPLRRHGDQIEALPGNFFRAHGRIDDTMNLGGIKVSSAEIEAVLNTLEGVQQTAAIAVPPAGGGPSQLVIHVEPSGDPPEADALRAEFQARIKRDLNPLFKVAEVLLLERLPRTASNKVMRRTLRAEYLKGRA